MTLNDSRELERFRTFLRLVGEAARAGVARDEAARVIYPDCYPEGAVEAADAMVVGALLYGAKVLGVLK